MIVAAAERLLSSVPVSDGDIAALRGRDSVLIAAAALHIWQGSGTHLLDVFLIVAAASSLLWLLASAIGRIVTLEPLLPEVKRNYVGVFALSFLRVLWAWFGIALCLAVIVASSFAAAEVSDNAAHPNFVLYFLLLAIGLPIVLMVWGALNWYLSLAPIFCLREGKRAFDSLGEAMREAGRRRREFWSISARYAVPRLLALVLLIVLAALAAAGLNQMSAIVVIVLLSLAYFALTDFFYIARMAAYIGLLGRKDVAEDLTATVLAKAEQPLPQSS